MVRSTVIRIVILLIALECAPAAARSQATAQAGTFRVFLTDGRTLPSYGEATVVGDRVVFMLPIGSGGQPQLQLMSLPTASVDVARTERYAESVRAAVYAAAHGEKDYAALTADVSHQIDQIKKERNRAKRLTMAEDAREKLVTWAQDHYSYRAADIQQLTGMLDEIIAQLRAAAGESKFSVDLAAGPSAPIREPLLPPPGLVESIQLALTAASATDQIPDREAILKTAVTAASSSPDAAALRTEAARQLDDELATDSRYRWLNADVLARADAAVRRTDLAALDALRIEALGHDLALGSRRPDDLQALLSQLDARRADVSTRRAVLDQFLAAHQGLVSYERRVQPMLAAFDRLEPLLSRVRDSTPVEFARVAETETRLQALARDLTALAPPADAREVQHSLVNAVAFARAACGKAKLWLETKSTEAQRDASAAAAGALLLMNQGRLDLTARLTPPKTP